MGDVQNLTNTEAIEKLRDLCKENIIMFCTYNSANKIDSRPMYVQEVDNNGTFWFFSAAESCKNLQVNKENDVELLLSNIKKDSYLHVSGTAEVVKDQAMIDKLWSAFLKTWFEGKDDPSLTLIKVIPHRAYYWDTKHGKIVSDIKILISTATGASMDDSREGELKVS